MELRVTIDFCLALIERKHIGRKIREFLAKLMAVTEIVFISGREDHPRQSTVKWLASAGNHPV